MRGEKEKKKKHFIKLDTKKKKLNSELTSYIKMTDILLLW